MLRSVAAPSPTLAQFSVSRHNPFKLNRLTITIPGNPFPSSNYTLTKTRNRTSQFPIHCEKISETDYESTIEESEEHDDGGCPWEGAIMYKRSATVLHLEYCTTLERLGLKKVSSKVSRSRASDMGMRVARSVKDYSDGTPVLISMDVTKKRRKLRLDGIVRTVIALHCYRCGEPAGQSVYSDFSLLLCEEPVQEPETINMGVIYGQGKSKKSGEKDDDDEDRLIDLDDRLYFPVEEKTIDISKNIRDLIHIEITINAVCDSSCRGACLKCGTDLNTGKCTCGSSPQTVQEKGYGSLGDLRKQMQQK